MDERTPRAAAGRAPALASRAVTEPTRPDWPFSHVDRVRFGDLDAMRHLNNVAFLGFFESARIAYVTSVVPAHRPDAPKSEGDFGVIFAECHIRYRAPAFYDEEIRTWIRPSHVARSAFRTEFEMRAVRDDRLLAEGYGVLVGYDYAAGRSQPLPEALRDALLADAPDAPSATPSQLSSCR